jgi:hypothetical protein
VFIYHRLLLIFQFLAALACCDGAKPNSSQLKGCESKVLLATQKLASYSSSYLALQIYMKTAIHKRCKKKTISTLS